MLKYLAGVFGFAIISALVFLSLLAIEAQRFQMVPTFILISIAAGWLCINAFSALLGWILLDPRRENRS